jgi:membrane protease YdiL (CAAX protease family)
MDQHHKQLAEKQSAHTPKPGALPVSILAAIIGVIVIYFGSMILGQLLLSTYPALRRMSAGQTERWLADDPAAQFAYVVTVEVLTLWFLYLVLQRRRISFAMLGFIKPRLHDLLATLAAYPPYFLLNAAAVLSATAIFHLDSGQQQQIGFDKVTTPIELIMTFISLVILPPIVEEIVMRGFLFGSLKNSMSVVRAALLTSLIFAIAHLQFGSGAPLLWVAAIDTFVLSLVLCYLRQRTGSLWPGIGLHALKNCLAFVTIFVLPHLHYSL